MKKTLILACAALAATGAMALTPVNSAHKSAYFCNGKLFEGISAPAMQDNGKKITRAGESQYVFSYDNGVGTAYTIPTPDGNSSVSSGVINCAMQFKEDDLKILAGKKSPRSVSILRPHRIMPTPSPTALSGFPPTFRRLRL